MADSRGTLHSYLLLLLLVTCSSGITNVGKNSWSFDLPAPEVPSEAGKEAVCANIDIRNSVEHFKKLKNCTVVEGFVQILLIERGTHHDFGNLSFPALREITGYLLLFRVRGLQSLAKLFPNLTVIRGTILFHNFAFVIYELQDIHEIGLGNFTTIVRGSVRLEKNPRLCYVDTIDWDKIAKAGTGGHYFKENRKQEECSNICPNDCPTSSLSGGVQRKLCWNYNVCQKVCSPECEHRNLTCSTKNMCCHAECLGGCSGKFSTECVACRHVKFKGMCKKECPQGTYEYLGHRCILENDCKAIKNQLPFHSNQQVTYWKPFKGECLPSCPAGYTENSKNKHECRACDDFCPKVCDGSVINNVATAQSFKSCTYVNGSLEIQIQGGSNVIKELDDNLGSIQEINGYLKIARSYPLKSLNFLKNLEYIHGESLDKKDYAFLVLDNQNLQELWDWENRKTKLHIKRGKIFFHFNSKLCVNKIKELETNADILPFDDRDVSPNSNGDRVACNVVSMNIHVWSITASAVGLRWKNFIKSYHDVDYRSLLGYVVYYREAPQRNVTIFDGQNACGSNVWKVDDVEGNEDADDIITILTQLKPFTTYAAYMRTYTTASAARGAQSPIIYFSTKPTNPSPPVNVRAHSTNHGEIVISWDSPKKPNGNVTHYMVSGLRERDSLEFISQRNYCKSSSLPGFKKVTDDKASDNEVPWLLNGTSSPETSDAENCCSCSENTRLGAKEKDAEFQTDFEDFLHNAVYVKNPNPVNVTKKNSSKGENLVKPNTTDSPVIENTTYLFNSSLTVSPKESSDIPLNATIPSEVEVNASTIAELQTINGSRFHHIVYDKLFLVVPNLHHFTEYTIEAKACQDPYEENGPPECSSQAITTVRTLPLAGADDIDSKTLCANLENATSGTVFIKWDQPLDPNGLIVSYQLEYKPAEANEDFKPISVCVTQSEYETKMGYSLHGLLPGNYSLKVLSTSLAGNGNWTLPTYFYIPDSRDGMKQEILAVITVVVCIALSLVIGIPFYFFYKKKYGLRIPDGILYASVNPEYMSAGLVYEPDEWEVPRDKITVLEELGQGSFGMVYKGEVKDMDELRPLMKCAIKTVNETASLRERIEFLQEASVMKAFDCHHVVKLLGVVSKGHPTLVIMELMANGDLKAYLRSHRPDNENLDCTPPTLRQILQMAAEIADGMAYLAAKKFVHRDLAARNCMVAEDMTVKIGDFGMTRDIYETDYYRKGGKGLLPVRWMAPECLKDGLFSNQSDVWSYGVVLWEMATLASQPYQGLSNEQVLKFVINGGTMEKPENCPEKLYALMKLCWEHNPKARPTFNELVEILLPDIRSNKFREVSFYFTEHLEMKNRENEDITDMVSQSTPLRTRWNENYFSHENSDDDSEVHYFPSTRNVLNESILHNPQSHHSSSHNFIDIPECQDTASTTNPNGSKGLSLHSTEGSKGISVASSDSSKESKVSNCSNGSIANGHVSFATGRTTEC